MYLRTYQLGEEVPLLIQCLNLLKRPADPDAAPRVAVYDNAGNVVKDFYLAVADKAETIGLFLGRLYLGSDFSPGHYRAVVRYAGGGFNFALDPICFEVIPGGAESGQVIAMHSYERPHSNFVVQQRTSGRIYKGRNARV